MDLTADELLAFIHGRLIPYLQNLGGDPLRETVRSVFAERNVIVCASGYNLKDVLQIVSGIDFHSQDDIFIVSQVYEELLRRPGNPFSVRGKKPVPALLGLMNIYGPARGSCATSDA